MDEPTDQPNDEPNDEPMDDEDEDEDESEVCDEPVIEIDHPRFRTVWASVFTKRMAADCMTHDCTMVDTSKKLIDACCQYGCDVDLRERDEILARAHTIRPLLRAEAQGEPWFDEEVVEDADYPSGSVVRSAVWNGGCLFLAHDHRGCAIHRASIEQGWDLHGVKPAICRLYPVSYAEDEIVIADEYEEYSCAHVDGPTLYRISRDALAAVFGDELVRVLDAAEAQVLGPQPKKLPIAR